jgi:hypothetical protein
MRLQLVIACTALLALTAGCGDVPIPPPAKQQQKPTAKGVQAKKPTPSATGGQPGSKPPAAPKRNRPPEAVARNADFDRTPSRVVGRAEEAAVKKITSVIKASLEVGPTLVVWIIDRTPSAEGMVRDVTAAATDFYESPEVRELSTAEGSPLLTALIAFDEQVQFVLDPPAGDLQKVKAGFDAIKPSSSGREMTFTAVKQSLDKYLPLRKEQQREVVIVVVTDEAGDDAKTVDDLVEPTLRNAIPVYVIGLPAPWGEMNPFAKTPKSVTESKDDSLPIVGPESLLSERVDIDNWKGHYATSLVSNLIDSGFGPFALERLCRASRGQFFALRAGRGYGFRPTSSNTWPTGDEMRFDDKVVSRYAPDYVSEAEYRKLLAENKARAVLVEAAKLPRVSIEGSPTSHFPKNVDAKNAEAKMAKQMTDAQRFAARNQQNVDRLHEILKDGESDRAKLNSPRWQAEFDLAYGRVLANKARLDGYNSMIAALKRGKNFTNPASKEWVLESADNFETESPIRKMAEKAKDYLNRVIHDHPGTPWAKIAEEELRLPLGWQWKEA